MENIKFSLENALAVTVVCVSTNYLLGYYLMSDELTMMEFSLFTLFYSTMLFITTLVVIVSRLPSYVRECMPRWPYVLGSNLFIILGLCLAIDAFYHYVIDNSLAIAFADSLGQVMEGNEELMSTYRQLSPFMQNYVLNTIAVVCALAISIPIAFNLGNKKERIKI